VQLKKSAGFRRCGSRSNLYKGKGSFINRDTDLSVSLFF
jgi:hypothetical protein